MGYIGVAPAATGSVGTNQIADTAVTAPKFNANVISAQTELAATPADTDEFLISDAGVIKRIDFSQFKGEKNDIYWDAYSDTNQTGLTSNAITTVVFNQVTNQSSSNPFNTSTGKFTVPSGGAGVYFASGRGQLYGTSGNHMRSNYQWIYKNGSSGIIANGTFLTANYFEGTQGTAFQVSAFVNLAEGDTLEVKSQTYSSSTYYIYGQVSVTRFFGFRISTV
jgi:hypothetical protein